MSILLDIYGTCYLIWNVLDNSWSGPADPWLSTKVARSTPRGPRFESCFAAGPCMLASPALNAECDVTTKKGPGNIEKLVFGEHPQELSQISRSVCTCIYIYVHILLLYVYIYIHIIIYILYILYYIYIYTYVYTIYTFADHKNNFLSYFPDIKINPCKKEQYLSTAGNVGLEVSQCLNIQMPARVLLESCEHDSTVPVSVDLPIVQHVTYSDKGWTNMCGFPGSGPKHPSRHRLVSADALLDSFRLRSKGALRRLLERQAVERNRQVALECFWQPDCIQEGIAIAGHSIAATHAEFSRWIRPSKI